MTLQQESNALYKLAYPNVWPVAVVRRGYAEFVANILKIDNGDKPSSYFIVESDDGVVTTIKKDVFNY